jgi:altronate dehydratase small subunit
MLQVPVTDGRLLFLNPKDNVCTEIAPISGATALQICGNTVVIKQSIPLGFKVAGRNIDTNESIIKYGVSIGSATRDIGLGELVHLHNMKSDYLPTYTLEKEDSRARRP